MTKTARANDGHQGKDGNAAKISSQAQPQAERATPGSAEGGAGGLLALVCGKRKKQSLGEEEAAVNTFPRAG